MEERCLQMIQELSDAHGPSGFEDEVVAVARKYAGNVGRIEEDKLRNLYIFRKENTGDKPLLMLDAHSDEVGFMIHSIRPNGTLRFVTLGGWNAGSLPSTKVIVRNKEGRWIPGIIAAKPVHFMSRAEREKGAVPEIKDLVIDIGATSDKEAAEAFGVRIGEPALPATRFAYDEEHDLMFGKAFDCRIGVAALLEAMIRLEGRELPVDVVGVLSSQEEVGERGCRVAVNHVRPDIAFAFEGCPADDTFTEPYAIQTALKKGPMLRFMDVSIICSPRYQRFVLDLAEKQGIQAQASVREGGGNNGAVINTAAEGIPVVVAGVPVRYIHSANCITTGQDFENTVRLAMAVAEGLNASLIASL